MSRPASIVLPADAVAPARSPEAPEPGTVLGPHYGKCFGCGEGPEVAANGLHLQVTVGEGVSIRAQFTVGEGHQGAPGLAHGGLLAAAFDEALGSLNWLLRVTAVTGKLETEYLRPVPVGTTLYITARCDGVAGRKIYNTAEGRLDAPDGPLAVRATAIFVQVGLAHFTGHGRAADVKAALADPDQLKVARAFEVNP